MSAKMPMSGSQEKRRDCTAQLPLRSPIFTLALNYVSTPIRFRQQLRNLGWPVGVLTRYNLSIYNWRIVDMIDLMKPQLDYRGPLLNLASILAICLSLS